MSLWARILGRGRSAPASGRWVVVDTETTGLDPESDALLAIGAVAVVDGRIGLDDSFEVTVRQESIRAGHDILIHGIGVGSQREGLSLADSVAAFQAYADDALLVGFHATFDQAVLRRAFDRVGQRLSPQPWLDVAELAPAILPALQERCRALDEWLSACAIRCDNRHNAAADALATAQLLVKLLPAASKQGLVGYEDLRKAARAGRWLGGRG